MAIVFRTALAAAATLASAAALAVPVYLAGPSTPLAACATCVVGTHLAAGPNGSMAGNGGVASTPPLARRWTVAAPTSTTWVTPARPPAR